MDLSILPYDIRWNIAHYITDIDTRRYFRIYDSIDMSKYNCLKTIIRVQKTHSHREQVTYEFIENKVNNPIRKAHFVSNDLISTHIVVLDSFVYYELKIFKLTKVPYEGYTNAADIFHKGPLEGDYYWQVFEFDYKVK